MKLTHLAVASAAAFTLVACSPEEKTTVAQPNQQANLRCQDPAVLPNIRESLQKMVRDEALKIAGQNHAQWIDADKLIAAAGLLEINLNNVENQATSCTGTLQVGIPKRIITSAKQNAPILNMDDPNTIIQQRLNSKQAQFADNTLTMPLTYSVTHQNQQFAITYNDTALSSISTTLASALQAYGVKEMLTINGKTISREQALDLIKNPQPVAPSAPEVAVKEVPTISSETETLPETPPTVKNETPPPTPAPPTPQPEKTIAPEKLAQTEQAHQNADRDIKQAWRNIDPTIQQSLVEEQKTWESQKRQRCLNAAAKGANNAESQYLHLQCDTQLTRERIKYLNGYSIKD